MENVQLVDHVRSQNLGDTVFIIGGGPSLMKYLPDRSLLDGKPVIATNNAYTLFPNAIVTHFADKVWWNWHHDKIFNLYKGPVSTCMHGSRENNKMFHDKGIAVFGFGDRSKDITTDKSKLNGNNCGHQAINLAVHFGFKNLVLFGFDMHPTNKQTHWHNDHQRPSNLDLYAGSMLPGMKSLVPWQDRLGFKIYNTNHESAITYFEYTDVNKWI